MVKKWDDVEISILSVSHLKLYTEQQRSQPAGHMITVSHSTPAPLEGNHQTRIVSNILKLKIERQRRLNWPISQFNVFTWCLVGCYCYLHQRIYFKEMVNWYILFKYLISVQCIFFLFIHFYKKTKMLLKKALIFSATIFCSFVLFYISSHHL